jgi:hypothetical protein
MMSLISLFTGPAAAEGPDVAVSVAVRTDEAPGDAAPADPVAAGPRIRVDSRHGFRVGYAYFPTAEGLDDPNLFVMGYETSQRLYGGAGLDVLLVQNATISGLNHSLVIPSANLLVGASVRDTVEIGVGPNLSVLPAPTANMIAAVGVTMPAGLFEIPVHAAWISAADGWGRVVLTTGVNWGAARLARTR